ncbi:hypothetical protein ACI77O_13405 [Pseudomonas tritici]|uniref:hypothetical protein n=1 Tax=Pseudomonas tritici TaxID=2745518 RepID=UPI00387A9189
MFTLRLLRFAPISKETHLVALVMGALGFILNAMLLPNSSAASSFSTAIVVGICWYVYKLFDGMEYDGAATAGGNVFGLVCVVSICCGYYLL